MEYGISKYIISYLREIFTTRGVNYEGYLWKAVS